MATIAEWFGDIYNKYNVNPTIFGIIYILSAIPCWVSIFKIVVAIKAKNRRKIVIWTIILAILLYAPYAYVYLFGKNYPFWFHIVFWGIIVVITLQIIYKIRKKIKK